ncbi:hypothetical protein [Micromonospora sp. MW-13]|uniref:hypothetical protein n=1 Tax=Micromonospora sp. MW-13 TaxID=2094022 RepID=UPI000E4370C2|nr:hypothetical protein [Micromonospora sp. MW-13]
MTFPLEALSVAVRARAETWARLGMRWHTHPIQSNYGKAELTTVRLADGRMVNKHYDLESRDDLERPTR